MSARSLLYNDYRGIPRRNSQQENNIQSHVSITTEIGETEAPSIRRLTKLLPDVRKRRLPHSPESELLDSRRGLPVNPL